MSIVSGSAVYGQHVLRRAAIVLFDVLNNWRRLAFVDHDAYVLDARHFRIGRSVRQDIAEGEARLVGSQNRREQEILTPMFVGLPLAVGHGKMCYRVSGSNDLDLGFGC